jgi:carbamoyl-phosphate synthase large subunit
VSLADRDKAAAVGAVQAFASAGLKIAATPGTAAFLTAHGVPVEQVVRKLSDAGEGPTAVDLLHDGQIQLVVNTPRGSSASLDGAEIRRACTITKVPVMTTVASAMAAANGIDEWATQRFSVRSLQEYLA